MINRNSDPLIAQAVRTGLCPRCNAAMIPNKEHTSATCSADCGFGVVPNCETYAPANEIARKKALAKESGRFPKAEKIPHFKRWRIGQGIYFRVCSITLRQAKRSLQRTQLSLLSDDVRPPKKGMIQLSKDQIVAVTSDFKIAIFEKVKP